jgi:hypothetical protein
MPKSAIRYIHEARGDAAKAALFQQCRNGQVAVLIGSTEMLGVGTNIQTRCAALHHVDGTWRPDQIEQREGRCHRPGNRYSHVDIFYYVQERTFDAYVWQMLKNKARFFKQLSSGKLSSREMQAQSDTELSYGQVMAAATGNPLLLEKAEIEVMLGRLERLAENHKRTCYRNTQDAQRFRQSAQERRDQIKRLSDLLTIMQACRLIGFVTKQGEFLEERQQIGLYIEKELMDVLMRSSRQWRPVGAWSDVPLYIRAEGTVERFEAEVLVGTEQNWGLRLSIPRSWFGSGQQWRIAGEVETFLARLPDQIAMAESLAERFDQEALQYKEQASLPFEKEDEYRTFLIRKIALDNYTAMVAAGGNQEELEAQKAALLAEATIDYTLEMEHEAVIEETTLLPAPIIEPIRELEPVIAVPPVSSYQEMVAQVEQRVENLSLDDLLAVSLFGADLPEQQAPISKARKKRSVAKKRTASVPSVKQLELLVRDFPTQREPALTLFDLLDEERDAA